MMGKLKDFRVVLDNNKTVYSSGEHVSGVCIVDLRNDMKLRGIRMYMRGLAKVHWTEQRGISSTGAYTQKYIAEEEYFYMQQTLFGKEENEEGANPILRMGRHELPFRFQIPIGRVATSFEGKYGRVRYWLKAEIDKPWVFNSRTKKAFTVIDHIDINTPSLLTPVGGDKEKTVCCWFCTSGPINMSARTDRKGYCPGESIAIMAEFENYSQRRITPKAALYQRTVFYAGGKSRSVRNSVATVQGEPIPAGRIARWDSKMLKIPAVTPSLVNCGIIKVEYILTIYLDISGAMNLYLHLPIVVGTVPLRAPPYSQCDPLAALGDVYLHLSGRNRVVPPPPVTPVPPPLNEAPPSYAECVFGATDIRDSDDNQYTVGDTMFTPMYTYVHDYRFIPAAPPPEYSRDDPNQISIQTQTEDSREQVS
ncbi:arrestin domain-containing protein 3-like [Ptychodera flava]|uniref:arrestin domain-containing protein 3-like n=1 Tax=Ptychodera flava TaxID=63121 RepID=UPI00396A0948